MEFGPRALGARSIIADARDGTMRTRINLKTKRRESFRPFAPSVLRERVSDYFEIDLDSPYMLLVVSVAEHRRVEMSEAQRDLRGIDLLNVARSDIPAVTHVDYSARIHTVHEETNPRYHRLIREFDRLTGCGVILNTSFNVQGEPIVCTPRDAYQCFMQTDIDVLVLENFVLDKTEQGAAQRSWEKESHNLPSVEKSPSVKQLRAFGLWLASICLLMGLWPSVRRGMSPRSGFLALGIVWAAGGLFRPKALVFVHRPWMRISRVLEWINTRVVLSIIFFAVFTPVALLLRLLGRRPMSLSFQKNLDTYRIHRKPRDSSHMQCQF